MLLRLAYLSVTNAVIVRGHGRQLGDMAKQGCYRSSAARPKAVQLVSTARNRDDLITQLCRFGYLH